MLAVINVLFKSHRKLNRSDDVLLASVCPIYMDPFQLVEPKNVVKILGEVRPNTCAIDPCPCWLKG